MSEIWKAVPGFEGLYEVSDLGRVRSLRSGRCIAQGPHPQGYLQFHLYKDGKQHCALGHRLVARAFLGEPPPGMEVCHRNGNKKRNRVTNLRYGTPVSNNADKKEHGTYLFGETHSQAVLTEQDVREIRAARGVPQKVLAERYGCTFSNISAIQRRKSWRHV